MTVSTLIGYLEDMNPDSEVRLAIQPRWAFEHSISGVAEVEVDGEYIVYIGEGSQLGYLPEGAAEEIW